MRRVLWVILLFPVACLARGTLDIVEVRTPASPLVDDSIIRTDVKYVKLPIENGQTVSPLVNLVTPGLGLELTATMDATYVLSVAYGNTTAMTAAAFSVALTGSITQSVPFDLDLNFSCVAAGTFPVQATVGLKWQDGDYDIFPLHFYKECPPPSCPACRNGTCVDFVCVCDSNFFGELCDLYMAVHPDRFCPGDTIRLSWEYFNLDYASGFDWWYIMADIFDTSPHNVTLEQAQGLLDVSVADPVGRYWGYFNGNQDVGAPAPVQTGHLDFVINDEDGPQAWIATLQLSDGYVVLAHVPLQLLGKQDPECAPATAVDHDCSSHGYGTYNSTSGVCLCEGWFFGPSCEHGCAPERNFTRWGADFASDWSGGSHIRRLSDCAFVIRPDSAETRSIVITFDYIRMASGDSIVIYEGDVVDEAAQVATFADAQQGPIVVTITNTSAIVTLVEDVENPDSLVPLSDGFTASYRALGCPAGYSVQVNADVANCVMCEPGFYTAHEDTEGNCTACPFQTYSDVEGATSCISCPFGQYQDVVGSDHCKSCAANNFPPLCPANPTPQAAVQTSFYTMNSSLTLAACLAAVFLALSRLDPVMIATGRAVVLVLNISAVLVLASSYLFLVKQTANICASKVWFLNLGMQAAVTAMGCKMMRLNQLLHFSGQLTAGHFSRLTQIGQFIVGALAMEIVILFAWSIKSPYELRADNFAQCTSPDTTLFSIMLLSTKAIAVLFGLYHANRSREIRVLYNEATWITAAFVNIAIVSVVMFAVYWVSNKPSSAAATFAGVAVYLVATTLAFVIGPKVWHVLQHKREAQSPIAALKADAAAADVNNKYFVAGGNANMVSKLPPPSTEPTVAEDANQKPEEQLKRQLEEINRINQQIAEKQAAIEAMKKTISATQAQAELLLLKLEEIQSESTQDGGASVIDNDGTSHGHGRPAWQGAHSDIDSPNVRSRVGSGVDTEGISSRRAVRKSSQVAPAPSPSLPSAVAPSPAIPSIVVSAEPEPPVSLHLPPPQESPLPNTLVPN